MTSHDTNGGRFGEHSRQAKWQDRSSSLTNASKHSMRMEYSRSLSKHQSPRTGGPTPALRNSRSNLDKIEAIIKGQLTLAEHSSEDYQQEEDHSQLSRLLHCAGQSEQMLIETPAGRHSSRGPQTLEKQGSRRFS